MGPMLKILYSGPKRGTGPPGPPPPPPDPPMHNKEKIAHGDCKSLLRQYGGPVCSETPHTPQGAFSKSHSRGYSQSHIPIHIDNW